MDLIDSVLEIGNGDLSDEQFIARFKDFYQRQFNSANLKFNGGEFLYMLYGAILSLPLTEKMTKHNMDGLLVAKKGNSLKLIVSYATPDNSLSLKLIHFDVNLIGPNIPSTEQSIVLDAQKQLTEIKRRRIDLTELKSALRVTNEVRFKYRIQQGPVTVLPQITRSPCDIDNALLNTFFKFPELSLVQQDPKLAESTSILVKQLQSSVYDVVKYNSHAFTKLLITQHQMIASNMQLHLSLDIRYMYLFLIGALEMNWAGSYRLKIRPIYGPSDNAIHGLMVNYVPITKPWKPESTPFVIQLLTSALPLYNKNYNGEIHNKIVDSLPYTQSEKVIVIGVEHKKLVEAFKGPVDVSSFQKLPFTFLLDMNPMENIVDLLLRPYTDSTLPKINYCIRNLNLNGKYGLHTYLYGQLMSYKNYDIEKFIFHSSALEQIRTTFVFKKRGENSGVLFDIFQTSSAFRIIKNLPSNFDGRSLPSTNHLNMESMLRIAVHQAHKISNEQIGKVQLIRSFAHFINVMQIPSENILQGQWQPISSLTPEYLLRNLENRPETYKQLPPLDVLHTTLNLGYNLLQNKDRITSLDIIHLMSGLFSDFNRIVYQSFLGILQNGGTPLFISALDVSFIDQEQPVKVKLNEVISRYLRSDYITNSLRRAANFICITRTLEYQNVFGLARLGTDGQYKRMFESCLSHSNIRVKRKLGTKMKCMIEYRSSDSTERTITDKEQPLEASFLQEKDSFPLQNFQTRMRSHLEIMNKVSKVIMTAQILKDIVSALIRGDYKTFALNTAFLASGPLLECLSMKMIAKGTSMGGSLLGRSLIISAPFLGRLPFMGFIGYDLYEQVKAYKNGTKDAMVNIAADSTILTIDFATASVEAAEALGLISGVADTIGPIGFAIGTAIFVGADIYTSVKTVSKIDAMVHLTGWQKFTTGFFSFLHVSPTKTVQKEIFEKTAADTSVDNAANFFKNYPSVKYYVFPSYKEDGQFVENNIIDLTTNVTRMAHSWPKNVANTKLICSSNSELRVEKTSRLLLNCSNSFGYESDSKDDKAVIFLANGNDTVKTFKERSTTFLIGNGNKSIIGSSQDDLFILNGNDTVGYIDGWSGKNVLNLANFAPSYPVRINLVNNQLIYSSGKIKTHKIHSVIGRAMVQDTVMCDCSTHYVDTQGGSFISADVISLKKTCPYNITININGTVIIKNHAVEGHFQYIVRKNVKAVVSQKLAVNITSIYIFEYNLEDVFLRQVVSLDNSSHHYNMTFGSKDNSTLKLTNVHHKAIFIFSDNAELKIDNGTVFINVVSSDAIANVREKYVSLARKFKALIYVFSTLKNVSMLFWSGSAIHHENSTLNNHINILPNDPNHETFLIGGENQNVFRIAAPLIHNSKACSLSSMPPVTIMNYAVNNFLNVIDLYEIILLIHEQFFGQVEVGIKRQKRNLLLQIFAKCHTESLTGIINVTLKDALENESYDHIVVNMRRPMKIVTNDNSFFLVPVDYVLKDDQQYIVITSGLVEPYTTVISRKILGNFSMSMHNNTDLVITNLKHVEEENNLVFIIFKDFFTSYELRTLRLLFPDQTVNLKQTIDEFKGEFQDFENFLLGL